MTVFNNVVRPHLLDVVLVNKVLISVKKIINLALQKSVKIVGLNFGSLQFGLGII